MREFTFIYSLSDPINGQVRYIGKSDNPSKRLNQHIKNYPNKTNYKNNWISSLTSKNLNPVLDVIDEVEISNWEYWEKYWISQFKAWGFQLTNSSEGGEGSHPSINGMKILSEKFTGAGNPMYGKNHTEETKEKIRKEKLGKASPNKGKTFSEETRNKQSKTRKGMHAGEKHPRVILNEIDVIDIRSEYSNSKITQEKLALKYNVTRACISNIVQKRTWKHI